MSVNLNKIKFGWLPDIPDARDKLYAAPMPISDLPDEVDLRPNMPGIYNQLSTSSCVAQTLGACFEFNQMKQGIPSCTPSRLFIYYNAREAAGLIEMDSGCMIRDAIKSMAKLGAPPEELWPFELDNITKKPTEKAYLAGLDNQVLLYQRIIRDLNQMRACLYSGYPFAVGLTLYSSFMSEEVAKTGIVPMPGTDEEMLGGHAVPIVGYNKDYFIGRNSWGTKWGMDGYFYIPKPYLTQRGLGSDYWNIRLVEERI